MGDAKNETFGVEDDMAVLEQEGQAEPETDGLEALEVPAED